MADNRGSSAVVVNQTLGGAAVGPEVHNGNYGSQTSGITVSHYSTGGITWPITVTSGHVLRLNANNPVAYGNKGAVEGWSIAPIRVQA